MKRSSLAILLAVVMLATCLFFTAPSARAEDTQVHSHTAETAHCVCAGVAVGVGENAVGIGEKGGITAVGVHACEGTAVPPDE